MPGIDPSNIQIKDYLHVKGVRLLEPGMPQWKVKPLQEKNLKLIAEHLEQESARKQEEEKWAAIPDWKKPLLQEKEKKNKELEEAQRKLQEAERIEKEKYERLPDWKKQLLNKKKSSTDTSSDTKSENSGTDYEANISTTESKGQNGFMEAEQNNATPDHGDEMSESSLTSASNMDPGDTAE